ncbi:hypothetical protein, partial [uncultured Bilophila sp.]|uniref:hypothetical protein n=1 Tax=uncultured Bilophila sp. TaxID=529385 RepID=UPI002670174E
KAGEKAVCSQCCGDETTTYYDRAKSIQGHAQAKELFLYSGKDGNRDSIRPKVFGGGGMGVWGKGGGSLSPERFLLPSPTFPTP